MQLSSRFSRLLAGLLMVCSTSLPAQEAMNLPDIGDTAATVLTPDREREIGQSVMRNIRRAGGLIDDPLVVSYINNLGYQLIAGAGQSPEHAFHFFVVKDESINAFALPGGYIGINYGLIMASQSESELASVVAHEIAHVTQRHHARAYEANSNSQIPIIAAMLAAMVLSGGNPEIGQAALTGAAAASVQKQIDFTRQNEKEADRIGIKMLSEAGFNTLSMADFFDKLDKQARLYGPQLPEFLRTHPVNTSRIADARSRAEQQKPMSISESKNYHLMRNRLTVLVSENPATTHQQLAKELEAGNYLNKEATVYGLALALLEMQQPQAARPYVEQLLAKEPNRIAYMLLQARLAEAADDLGGALAHYDQALSLYPGNAAITQDFAEALLKAEKAKQAKQLLEDYLKTRNSQPDFYRLLSRAESSLGDAVAAHQAMAEYYFQIGQVHQAIDQIQLALKFDNIDYYTSARLEARLSKYKDHIPRDK